MTALAQNTPATTAQTARVRPQAGHFRCRLGNFEITALSDGSVPQDLHGLLKGTSAGEIDSLLTPAQRANPVECSINAYLIDTGSRLMLVDGGAGDFFGPGDGGKLVARLKSVGIEPAHISDILLTHVHTDHSGGLVHAGQARFPNATVHVGKGDIDFFLARQNQQGVDGCDKAYFQQATLSLSPYLALGRIKPFSGVTELAPGVTAVPTPGHTPGRSFFRVESEGRSITFIGDIVHVQAVQFPKPEIMITYDVDNDAARRQPLTPSAARRTRAWWWPRRTCHSPASARCAPRARASCSCRWTRRTATACETRPSRHSQQTVALNEVARGSDGARGHRPVWTYCAGELAGNALTTMGAVDEPLAATFAFPCFSATVSDRMPTASFRMTSLIEALAFSAAMSGPSLRSLNSKPSSASALVAAWAAVAPSAASLAVRRFACAARSRRRTTSFSEITFFLRRSCTRSTSSSRL
jgi:glyoxylase-like metal-dependent hydrolase (beta-lactamase superfamily II)